MNEQLRKNIIEEKLEEIKNLDINIRPCDLKEIRELKNLTGDTFINELDRYVDEYFKKSFLENYTDYDNNITETIEGVDIVEIGNGVRGYIFNKVNYTDEKDLVTMLEENNYSDEVIESIISY